MPEPMDDEERSTTRTRECQPAACSRVADATKDDSDNDDDKSDSDDTTDEGYEPPGSYPKHLTTLKFTRWITFDLIHSEITQFTEQ